MERIILIGFMGVGKSTLGKKIAKRLNVPFIDSDQEIEKSHNKTIGEIFAEFGESRFREMEREFLRSLDKTKPFVLATGGGMPCYGNTMAELNKIGQTFYLKRSSKEILHRLIHAKKKRPLIDGLSEDDLLVFIESKLEERREFYKKAFYTLEREEQNIDQFEKIIHLLQQPQKS